MLGTTFRCLLGIGKQGKHFTNQNFRISGSFLKSFCTKNDLYQIDFEKITKGDENAMKHLKMIMLEFELMKQENVKVPSVMNTERWSELLAAKTKSQRLKTVRFWALNERQKEKIKEKKEQKRLALASKDIEDDGHIKYGFGGSTMFLRVYDTTIDRWNNSKMIEAMMYDQSIVFDCSYDPHMSDREAKNCAKQLTYCFAKNRLHRSPFNMHFVNANREGRLMQILQRHVPSIYNDDFPINISEKSYLELFPKEKLVYLTPHCREELINYNHDDIYIIGAMVDKINNEPLSLGKAKSEGIRMAKLPLDKYLDWLLGTKSLTLDQVLMIMLDMKTTNDWTEALKHVPRRKLKNEKDQTEVRFLNKKFKEFDGHRIKRNFNVKKMLADTN